MFSDWSLKTKGLVLVLVPVTLTVAFVAVLAWILHESAQEFDQIEKSNAILMTLGKTESIIGRGIAHLTLGKAAPQQQLPIVDDLLSQFQPGRPLHDMPEVVPELSEVYQDMRDLRAGAFKTLVLLKKDLSESVAERKRSGRSIVAPQAVALYMESHDVSKKLVQATEAMQAEEPAKIEQQNSKVTLAFAGFIALNFVVTLALARFMTADIVVRLLDIEKNAKHLAADEDLHLPGQGKDEIAELDRALYTSSLIIADNRKKEVAILENAADIICSLDQKFRIRASGAAVTKVWKYTQEDLLGMQLASLLTNESIESTRQALQQIANTSGHGQVENIVRCKDGQLKNSLWTVSYSPAEKTYYCVVHDVTELRAIENLKQQFLSMVSHDLRTPLTSVGVSFSLLTEGKRGEVSQAVLEMLAKAQRSMQRLMDLVNELLELEKLQSGKMQLDLACVSASDVCTAAKESLESMADMAGVKIKGPKGEAAVMADEGRLVQAITNLLSNALKFSPAGSTVTLSIEEDQNDGLIKVSDEGPGIPEEQRSLLFEKFSQTAVKSNIAVKGTGLGLAITRAIVDAHGGQIGVDSRIGEGTTFWIRLPLFSDKDGGSI